MNNIPVVFASDNNYIVPTIVSITSMLKNKNQDTFYNIFILDSGIANDNKAKFTWDEFLDHYKINFIPIDLTEIENKNCYGTWTPVIYAKYFICDLLPEFNKCLWLDSDTIILSDLSQLFNTELNDNYLGAVKSPLTNYNVSAEKHSYLSRDEYSLKCINVGMLVLNLKMLRELGGGSFFMEKTIETISLLPPGSLVTEQDMFTKLLSDRIVYLPLKFNQFVINILNNSERHYYPFCFKSSDIEDAFSNPVIIHFTVPEKPWVYSNAKNVYLSFYKFTASLWYDYFLKSPVRRQKLKRKRLGFLLILYYHLKPYLKKNKMLLKLKRNITKTKISSPMHDFFD